MAVRRWAAAKSERWIRSAILMRSWRAWIEEVAKPRGSGGGGGWIWWCRWG